SAGPSTRGASVSQPASSSNGNSNARFMPLFIESPIDRVRESSCHRAAQVGFRPLVAQRLQDGEQVAAGPAGGQPSPALFERAARGSGIALAETQPAQRIEERRVRGRTAMRGLDQGARFIDPVVV